MRSLDEEKKRVIIEHVEPEIDCGQFPLKRVVGEKVVVQTDIFSDGHDVVSAKLLYRKVPESQWREVEMHFSENDRYTGEFIVEDIGVYYYSVKAFVNHFRTWQRDLNSKLEVGQNVVFEIQTGINYVNMVAERTKGSNHKDRLRKFARLLEKNKKVDINEAASIALSSELALLIDSYEENLHTTTYERELEVIVDRRKSLFSTWYELFPRSCSPIKENHGRLSDCERLLPELAEMGFDVLYLPPIHPIGLTNRKGRNNLPTSGSSDPGSPWAIGSEEGGHKAIHPQLGAFADFEELIKKAGKLDIEVALDLAFQCSPDHPYLKEHPEWFSWLPDGSIRYAENPPKKYEDIVPFNFETDDWQSLWEELKSIVLFWIEKGVKIFRVDNPHTKPFRFWAWLLREVKGQHPDVIFLSEAFTRPKVMHHLAKLGFTQSYTYYTWRNTKSELIDYLNELTTTNIKEYFRPNFWTNTPDILSEYLQHGSKPAFIVRLVLAATLSSNYGIYGPAYELCVAQPLPGKEEYSDSEKYEIKHWTREKQGNIKEVITKVNKIRRENPALQTTYNLKFCEIQNDSIICYVRATDDLSNIIMVAVNLDPVNAQSGWVKVPLHEVGIPPSQPFLMHDLLSDAKFIWDKEWNYVELNPRTMPAHIFSLRKRLRRETDADYFG